MKIIIASDNHYNQQVLEIIQGRHEAEADIFIHCGDSQLPYDSPLMKPYLKVAGNCDYDRHYPKEQVTDLTAHDKLFVTHGHEYGVKSHTSQLVSRARELGAQIALYGHSHCVDVCWEQGLLLINPGSTFLPKNTREKTYASLDIDENHYLVKILQVETGNILMEKMFRKGG